MPRSRRKDSWLATPQPQTLKTTESTNKFAFKAVSTIITQQSSNENWKKRLTVNVATLEVHHSAAVAKNYSLSRPVNWNMSYIISSNSVNDWKYCQSIGNDSDSCLVIEQLSKEKLYSRGGTAVSDCRCEQYDKSSAISSVCECVSITNRENNGHW